MIVAKVGGSLFDLPQLGPALARWAAEQPAPVLYVPGGGPFADVIRALDRVHDLGDEAAHWGSYYDHRPVVLAGQLQPALPLLARRAAGA